MDIQGLTNAMKGLEAMPESELQFVSKDPVKAGMDCQIYLACVEKGDMTAWEKLKLARKIFAK